MKAAAWKSIIQQQRFYRLARDIRCCLDRYMSQEERHRFRVISLRPDGRSKGNVLISRNHQCFFLEEALLRAHNMNWEVRQMATMFVNQGYAVDVVHYLNDVFVPRQDYTLFIDAKWNMKRIAPLLNRDCIKVLHTVFAHPIFHNRAELNRLLALQQRRGIVLSPRRRIPVDWALEHADCAAVLGNDFTLATYRYAQKPLYRVPCATPFLYPSPEAKDYTLCRNRFLFMAGDGMVHKGLDRVLEVFAAMPEYFLTVCGSVDKEPEFVRAYHRELYETENIKFVGWVDVASDTFQNIVASCVAVLHPSCSEGSSTTVVNCMHAGLIPISSVESGVDVDPEFGVVLKKSSIEEIRETVQWVAGLPPARLQEMARAAWREAREKHTPEKFVETYAEIVTHLLEGQRLRTATADREVLSSPLPAQENADRM